VSIFVNLPEIISMFMVRYEVWIVHFRQR